MKELYTEAQRFAEIHEVLQIELPTSVAGINREISVSWEQICELLDHDELDTIHISLWISYLVDVKMRDDGVPPSTYGFMDPYVLSSKVSHTFEERVDLIANQLTQPNQLSFYPYNEIGKHWLLTVVSTAKNTVYWLDSTNALLRREESWIRFCEQYPSKLLLLVQLLRSLNRMTVSVVDTTYTAICLRSFTINILRASHLRSIIRLSIQQMIFSTSKMNGLGTF